MVCKKCGKKYHYCGSCDSEDCKDYSYCSDGCYMSSEDYKLRTGHFDDFVATLSDKQKTLLGLLLLNWEDGYTYHDDELLNDAIIRAGGR